jgi:UDP-GlcNAc:undecaprenyl-phosphate GlcNAc-1-phosphate transferase
MRYLDAVYAFLAATAIATGLTPLIGRLARRAGAMSHPSKRGLAKVSMPLWGGLAILVGVLVTAAIWMPNEIRLAPSPHALPGSAGTVYTWWVLAGAVIITLVGAIDDRFPMKPIVKLIGQIVAAVVAVEAGAVINDLTIPFVGALQFVHASGPITVLWLVALMNIVNFSDGVDGLAAGVCTIDSVAFTIIAFNLQGAGSAAAVLSAIIAGAALGFLFHNFYPAKIFMGDAGANLLGYLLGVTAVIGSIKTNVVVALAVPLLVLAVPFLDTSFVIAKRLKYKHAPWEADAEHFHHRLAKIGFSQRKTVLYLYGWTSVLAGVAVALRFVPYHRDGVYHLGWGLVMIAILLIAVATSIYLVYVLEIFKFKWLRSIQMRHMNEDTSEHEIVKQVQHEVATGEFDAVKRPPRQ